MGFSLDICNISMEYEYLDSLSKNEYDRYIHLKKKSKIRVTLK